MKNLTNLRKNFCEFKHSNFALVNSKIVKYVTKLLILGKESSCTADLAYHKDYQNHKYRVSRIVAFIVKYTGGPH